MSWTLYVLLLLGSQYINPKCKNPPDTIGFFGIANRTHCVPVHPTNETLENLDAADPSTKKEHNANIIFGLFEFLFYVGWLTVAKIMLNPFGKDDDDVDINYIIDRNLETSFWIVNDDKDDHEPDVMVDPSYWRWDEGVPKKALEGLEMPHKETGPLKVDELLADYEKAESESCGYCP